MLCITGAVRGDEGVLFTRQLYVHVIAFAPVLPQAGCVVIVMANGEVLPTARVVSADSSHPSVDVLFSATASSAGVAPTIFRLDLGTR